MLGTALSRRAFRLVSCGVLALLNGLILLTPWPSVRACAALLLAGGAPAAFTWILVGENRGRGSGLEALLLIGGLALAYLLLGGLLLHYLPGSLSRSLVLLSYSVLSLGLMGLLRAHGGPGPLRLRLRLSRRWAALVAVLILATLLRFVHLGYSEFQGDEVAVLHRAAAAIAGREDALFLHKKGPAEILLAMVPYAASQRVSELAARLPYALASVATVLGAYCIARRALSERAALWGALLLALNGFCIAFGRIVQYQSLVLLLSVLCLLAAQRFQREGRSVDLWLCALFGALGLWCHSDAAYVLPAAFLLIASRLWARPYSVRVIAARLSGPVVLGLALLALFFVPYARHPFFATTRVYLASRWGSAPPYANWEQLLNLGSVYNASYYLLFMAGGLVVWAVWRLRGLVRPAMLAPLVAAGLLLQSWIHPSAWQAGGRSYVGLLYLAILIALLLLPREALGWRALLLWFSVPFWLYLFWVEDPRTHLYILFPGASLLLGEGLAALQGRSWARRWVFLLPVGGVLALSLVYVWMAFVSHSPEYKRNYPETRQPLFWVPYGDAMPTKGLFGFPYRAGWKAVGSLYAAGLLQGDYASNEESHITEWYLRGAPECACNPEYYFIAENVQDVQPTPFEAIAREYELIGQVMVGGEPRLRLYERAPARLSLGGLDLRSFETSFDRTASAPRDPMALFPGDPLREMDEPLQCRLGEAIELTGYSVDRRTARPGEALTVTLFWRALATPAGPYIAFVHVEDPGVVWAGKDCAPGCGAHPTPEWQAGEVYRDSHTLLLVEDTPPGEHALMVGMYHRESRQRLPIVGPCRALGGDAISLGAIQVLPR
ncbi:MAG: glycosyltransferase family 39 protein [Anaerolineae bacterium]|nr:glycosyltransferase family 39 protein [Anaerolineae bacterium]